MAHSTSSRLWTLQHTTATLQSLSSPASVMKTRRGAGGVHFMDVDHGCWHTTDYHYDWRLVVAPGQTGSGHQAIRPVLSL